MRSLCCSILLPQPLLGGFRTHPEHTLDILSSSKWAQTWVIHSVEGTVSPSKANVCMAGSPVWAPPEFIPSITTEQSWVNGHSSLGSHAKKIASRWGPVWVGGQESACAGVSWAGELGLCTDRSTLRSQLLHLHEGQGETGDWSLEIFWQEELGMISRTRGQAATGSCQEKKKKTR